MWGTMKHFAAIKVFLQNPITWTLYGVVAALLMMIPILGWLLLGAMIAGATRAVREDRAPSVSDMFDFTGAGGMAFYGGAQILGAFVPFGQLAAWILFWFAPELSTMHGLNATQSMKASFRVVTRHALGAIVIFVLGGLLYELLASLVIGAIFVVPAVLMTLNSVAGGLVMVLAVLAALFFTVPFGNCIWLIA
jgi:hypothetical protein